MSLANTAAPADNSLIRSKQVSPLPIGPGGNSPTKQQLNDTNVQLTMLTSQAAANTKYDPPVPKPVTKQVTKESFINYDYTTACTALYLAGGLFIVYGFISK
jgi:hypothetical protein